MGDMCVSVGRAVCEREGALVRVAVALALLCACAVCADSEKRAEMSPLPFVLGSRYGRSPQRHLSPRNDRFFLGSRYGKRSQWVSPGARDSSTLVCRYTGLAALFTCHTMQPHALINRPEDDASLTEED